MMERYKYLGYDKEVVLKCRKNMDRDNIKTVKNVSVLLVLILFILIAFYLIFDNVLRRNLICFTSALLLTLLYGLSRYLLANEEKITPAASDFLLDFFSFLCFIVGIYLGTFASGGAMAVAPVWMFFFVTLIFNRLPLKNLAILTIAGVVYVICCFFTKEEFVFKYDVMHGATSILASLYMAWMKSQMKVENILALRTLEKANLAILETVEEQEKEADILRKKAQFDGLTGLYHKKDFEKEVKSIIEQSQDDSLHALICLDVDDFKVVNDSQGHLRGDEVLKEVAVLIYTMFRKKDIAGRFGGDEFTVLIRDIPNDKAVFDKVNELLIRIKQKEKVSVSAGIAMYPSDAATYEELFVRADEALYQAKKSGKNICCFCSKK